MRAPAFLSVLVLAAAVAPAVEAQVKGPSEVTVAVGRLAAIPLTVDGDESDYAVLGSDVDAFREFTTDPKQIRLRVIGYAPGVAYVVVASQKGGKLQPVFVVKVTVTGAPPPIPPTPPTPPVPPPVDPLAVALKAAAAADGIPPTGLASLAATLRGAADLVKNRTAARDFQVLLGTALTNWRPTKPVAIWAALQPALDALERVAPSDQPDHVLSAEDKATAAVVLRSIAASAEGASK